MGCYGVEKKRNVMIRLVQFNTSQEPTKVHFCKGGLFHTTIELLLSSPGSEGNLQEEYTENYCGEGVVVTHTEPFNA